MDTPNKLKKIKHLPLFITEAGVKKFNPNDTKPINRISSVYQTREYSSRRFFKPIELK